LQRVMADLPESRNAQQMQPDSISEWMRRLNSLPEDQQYHISKKYYGGKRPWKEQKHDRTVQR